MKRDKMLRRLADRVKPFDLLIVGGGATGAGIAVDAASRGYEVAVVERFDFGKGTSSRSTKLVHGGVRYLEQGNIALVMEALRERGRLLRNAPHLVRDLPFIVPTYSWWESPFYGIGLKVYDLLAGKYRFGKSKLLSADETLERLPTIKTDGLRGGIVYHDGQFDDARLLIHLIATAVDYGAVAANYAAVVRLNLDSDGVVNGAVVVDAESEAEIAVQARVVVNATGAFCDGIRGMVDSRVRPLVSPSQGAHLVFDRSFLAGDSAIMVPHTPDGRVMFAIPWHDHVVVGTTDVAVTAAPLEPMATREEVEFILETSSRYLARTPTVGDVRSVFAGIRPLVKADASSTAALSREHTIHVDACGLMTIVGGKWTTYRAMAQDCVDEATVLGGLKESPCRTKRLRIHGYCEDAAAFGHLQPYGADAAEVLAIVNGSSVLGQRLHPNLPYTAAEVVFAVRHEMARTVEDVLARRTRALFLNARAALAAAPKVAELMAAELDKSTSWQRQEIENFGRIAAGYSLSNVPGPAGETPAPHFCDSEHGERRSPKTKE